MEELDITDVICLNKNSKHKTVGNFTYPGNPDQPNK
jgi:hypothetical protein